MHAAWQHMFVLGLPIVEKIVRPVIVYAFLVIGLRIAGKRELAQLNPFDLVVLLTLSNTVQNAIIGDDNSVTGGIIGASSLLFVNYLVVRFLYRHRRLDELVEGGCETLIENGKVHTRHLKRELITISQLQSAARKQGFDSLADVQQCILEPGGTLTFIAKKPQTEEIRHRELVERLDHITSELIRLRAPAPSSPA
ncbi:MAG TPA: YetF domain-containing protein [Candidatus Acidoferrum sp.]|jgi:uncharacterized membrane protein YcaP (DUF421 family)|nr:YetF domain-containing protein [Candidatus Acidoferrum sp.]